MSDQDLTDPLAELFRGAADAHHDAFRDTDGQDPDWATWYAQFLSASIHELTKLKFTKSELVAFLVDVDKEHRQKASQTEWARYYASAFLQKFKA